MAFAISIGQYVPKASPVHRMDARVKLLLVTAYVVALFLTSGWIGLGICTALLVSCYALARIPLGLALRGLKPIVYILCFTLVFSLFTLDAGTASATQGTAPLIGSFGLNPQGLVQGFFLALRIVLFFAMTSLLTYTSTLIEISDAASALLRPFERFGLPVEDIAIVFALTLRFVPSTVEEAEKIMLAQKSRGLNFDEGGLMKRAQAWIPVIIPLFVSLFRRAEHLASAMEARCYTSTGRTHLHTAALTRADIMIGIMGIIVLATMIVAF